MAYKCRCGGKIIWSGTQLTELHVNSDGVTGNVELEGQCEECGKKYSGVLDGDIVPVDNLIKED